MSTFFGGVAYTNGRFCVHAGIREQNMVTFWLSHVSRRHSNRTLYSLTHWESFNGIK